MYTTIKIYLQNRDFTTKEIRKFEIPSDNLTFRALREKISQKFPNLAENYAVLYPDSIGDYITVSSADEFDIALKESMGGNIKIFYIRPTINIEESSSCNVNKDSSPLKHDVKHVGVVCDGCNNDITGNRYKCIQCDDFDLCAKCEASGHHPHHFMIRMPHPIQWKQSKELQHNLKSILKNNTVHPHKRHASDAHSFRGRHCKIPALTLAFPDLDNIISALLDIRVCDPDPPKAQQEEKKKEEPHSSRNVEANGENKFPGEGKKLFDEAKQDKDSMSDASVASQENSNTKLPTDEWMIVDEEEVNKKENPTTSVSQNTVEADVPSSSTLKPSTHETISADQRLYPSLNENENVVHSSNPVINKAVNTMIEMGFSNQNQLLTYLLVSENGDINRVLEILHSTKK